MITENALADLRDELLKLGTATLYEASRLECFLPASLRPVWDGSTMVGTALPVRLLAGDNLGIHLAVEAAQPGDVLIVDGGGAPHGYWGEVLTIAAQVRGIRGLIIDGGVRDTVRLAELGFPVFSRSIALEGTRKADRGSVGDPLRLGRTDIRRGDVVVADADGIVVFPEERLDAVLVAARGRAAEEADIFQRLRTGETTVDIYGFRSPAASTPSREESL